MRWGNKMCIYGLVLVYNIYEMTDKLELTLWQRIVNNVDADHIEKINVREWDVAMVKELMSNLIDRMDEVRKENENNDVKRLASISISKLEEACMFVIKTFTYNK